MSGNDLLYLKSRTISRSACGIRLNALSNV